MDQPPKTNDNSGARVCVLTILEKDAALICDVLRKADIHAGVCPGADAASLSAAIQGDCLIVTEELLTPELIQVLQERLKRQPPWSDFPLILLTSQGEVSAYTQKRRQLRQPLGNMVLLERPIRPETLINAVQHALRARQRQYQMRDQIEQYKRAQEGLRQSEKLAVAGRLASSIAHEINNPLESVTNLLYLMHSSDSIADIRKYLNVAENELARVTEIATRTLQFYRQPSKPCPVILTDILDSVLALYHPRLVSAGILVEKRFDNVWPITGLSGELRQVFSNLVGNALDAMRNGGRLVLRAHNSADHSNGLKTGVRVTIADTGTGIPAELCRKIFDPFVTTKGATGTGLGLWISSEIVQKHGGRIHVKSRTDEATRSGAVFSIFLPSQANIAA